MKSKLSLLLTAALSIASIDAQSVTAKIEQSESRLQQLEKRIKKEVNEFVRCVKSGNDCDQNRKKLYMAIGALIVIVGATVAGRLVKGYQKSKRRQPVIVKDEGSSDDDSKDRRNLLGGGSNQGVVVDRADSGSKDEDDSGLPRAKMPKTDYDDFLNFDAAISGSSSSSSEKPVYPDYTRKIQDEEVDEFDF